ncbi:MAG: glycosyltransferase family 2 protein [Candidatus Promineifilaceae bacterium]
MVDLAIVIVNYNVSALLRRCLQTVFASRGDFTYAVSVVDNASRDDSVAMVRAEFPQVRVIANAENVGYPAGNNQGLRALGIEDDQPPRYVLLLNPDTELPPDALFTMLQFMDQNTDVGIVGPRLVLPTGQLDLACRRGFPSPTVSLYRFLGLSRLFPHSRRFGRYNMTFLDEHEQADVDSVVGAFMLVRGAAVRQVGLMDERFWMYGEDLDWAKRIKDAGWRVVYNPAVTVLHVKRASSRQNRQKTQYEFYRAMPIFYYKHYRQQTPWWLHWLIIIGIGLKAGPALWPDLLAGPAILTPQA